VRCTIECSDKVEDGDEENSFNGPVKVAEKQHAGMVFLPSRKIEIA
jgi:hypothetical protein